jgi:hypothetical protein
LPETLAVTGLQHFRNVPYASSRRFRSFGTDHTQLVAPTQRSTAAQLKINRRQLDDGSATRSFSTLTAELSPHVRNTCCVPGAANAPGFKVLTMEYRVIIKLICSKTAVG